jgi:hypothetical protein
VDVAIRATDGAFLDQLRGYIGQYRVDEQPERYVLFSADTGLQRELAGGKRVHGRSSLYVNTLMVYSGRLWDEMAGRFISMLRDMATTNANEFLRIRAVGVQFDGQTVLMPSGPNAHLPALAAAALERGGRFLGDEIVNIDPVLGHAFPVDLPLLIDSDDVVSFPRLGREAPRGRSTRGGGATTPRRPVAASELDASVGVPATVTAVLVPSFEPGADSAVVPMTSAEAVFAITSAVLNLHIWNERAVLLARRVLEGARVARLVVGDYAEAAEVTARWAREGGEPA